MASIDKGIPIPGAEYEDERIVAWDCPHCHNRIDRREKEYEEYTVGGLGGLPHIRCPHCSFCCGCDERIGD